MLCSALDTGEVDAVDTLTTDDAAVASPTELAEWAYHLGLRLDEVDAATDLVGAAFVVEPLYVPDGWHL